MRHTTVMFRVLRAPGPDFAARYTAAARESGRGRDQEPMERLTDGVELLDGRLDDPDALAGNLRDLGRINRLLGGVMLSAAAIEALAAHRDELTLLDVGTGGATKVADEPGQAVRMSG